MKFHKYIHLELININKDKDTKLLFLKTLQYNHGENTILVPTFWGLQSIWSLHFGSCQLGS